MPGAQQVLYTPSTCWWPKTFKRYTSIITPLVYLEPNHPTFFLKKSPMRSNRLHGQLYTVKREELKMHLDARGRKQISSQWFFEMCFDLNYSQSFLQASTIFHFLSMCFAFLVNFKRFKGAQVKSWMLFISWTSRKNTKGLCIGYTKNLRNLR
jgi:hypothetical protein